jgi:hypothetical protein
MGLRLERPKLALCQFVRISTILLIKWDVIDIDTNLD